MRPTNTIFGKFIICCLQPSALGPPCVNGCIYREKTHSQAACKLRSDMYKCAAPCETWCLCNPYYGGREKNEFLPKHIPSLQLQ